MTLSGPVRVALLALAGLAVAIGISVLARHLVSEPIGLAGQPFSAGRELAPPRHATARRAGTGQGDSTTTTTTTTTTTPPATTTAPYTGGTTVAPPPAQPGGSGGGSEPPDD